MRVFKLLAIHSTVFITGAVAADSSPALTAMAHHAGASRAAGYVRFVNEQHISERELEVFMTRLKKAVAANDKTAVASMILYPIAIEAGGRSMLFRTPASLIPSYDLIFTPHLKSLIADAKPKEMFKNWQGAMIHEGELWINLVNSRGLKIVTIQNQTGRNEEIKPKAPNFKLHPKVFSLIQSMLSDSEYPVVTEINLDAVRANDNQFPNDEVKQEGEWCVYPHEDGQGWIAYRILEAVGNKYTIQFSDNAGGTLSTSAIVEAIVERRVIQKDGRPKTIRVLRVLSYTSR